jgi:hypothetical protein
MIAKNKELRMFRIKFDSQIKAFAALSTNQLTFLVLRFMTGPVVGVIVTEGVIDKFEDRPSNTFP